MVATDLPRSGLSPPVARRRAGGAGVVAAGAALAVTELVAGLWAAVPSLVVTVGDAIIDVLPGAVVEAAIDVLGRYNRPVLVASILLVAAAAGAALGVAGVRRWTVAVGGFVGFAAAGTLAAAGSEQVSAVPAGLSAAAGAAVGLLVLRGLYDRAGPLGPQRPEAVPDATSRRRFLTAATVVAGVAAVAAATGRVLAVRSSVEQVRQSLALPGVDRPLPAAPAGAELGVDGLAPLYTPNSEFYRIDTALTPPQVDPGGWSLRVDGMVERELELTYDDLLAMPQVEADVTLACVSNEVGGDLIGNARWRGVWLPDVLREAGVDPAADQVVGRAVDGWTAGFPVSAAFDGRDALIAVGMNGEPLPVRHGFPARLVIAGLYGYVSDTKWLAEIELTTFDAYDAYWVPRGWAREGPIKTQSRIDVPREWASFDAGPVTIAGVAWAGVRGVSRVEVQVDDGSWHEATLAEELDVDTWRQWVYVWDAPPGAHRIRVRATDGAGETQTARRSDPAPDGATGQHSIAVEVA